MDAAVSVWRGPVSEQLSNAPEQTLLPPFNNVELLQLSIVHGAFYQRHNEEREPSEQFHRGDEVQFGQYCSLRDPDRDAGRSAIQPINKKKRSVRYAHSIGDQVCT